jgi:hypothetical protein
MRRIAAKTRSRGWRLTVALLITLALLPLAHIHSLGADDSRVTHAANGLCGACAAGVADGIPDSPPSPVLTSSGRVVTDRQVVSSRAIVRDSGSRAPPAAS